MKYRLRRRSSNSTRHTLLESLELRRLLSVSVMPTSLGVSLNWVPAAIASANLTAAADGSLFYTSGASVDHVAPGGATSVFILSGSGSFAASLSDLATGNDAGVYFIIHDGLDSRVGHLNDDTLAPLNDPSTESADTLATVGTALWFTRGDYVLEHLSNGGSLTSFAISGISDFAALTADRLGNAWFVANGASGGGVVGRVTPAGEVTTFNVDADPTDITAAANGSIYVGEHNAIWRIAADGTMTKTDLPDMTATDLTPAADGGIWFLDAAHAARVVNRLNADGSLTHLGTNAPGAIDSIAVTPDGTLWILSPGALASWRGQTISPFTGTVVQNAESVGAISFSSLGILTVTSATNVQGNLTDTSADTAPVTPSTTGSTTTSKDDSGTTSDTPTAARSTTSNKPDNARHPVGDPGTFQGEFGVASQPVLPERDPPVSGRRTQSNATPVNPQTSPTPAPQQTHADWITDNIARLPADIFIAAVPEAANKAVFPAPSSPKEAAATAAEEPTANLIIVVASRSSAEAAVAANAPTPHGPHAAQENADAIARWWKLALYTSSAMAIEIGRENQRYFRI